MQQFLVSVGSVTETAKEVVIVYSPLHDFRGGQMKDSLGHGKEAFKAYGQQMGNGLRSSREAGGDHGSNFAVAGRLAEGDKPVARHRACGGVG